MGYKEKTAEPKRELHPDLQALMKARPEVSYPYPTIDLYISALKNRLEISEEGIAELRRTNAKLEDWMSAVQLMKDDRPAVKARIGSREILLRSDMSLPDRVTRNTPVRQIIQADALCLAKLGIIRELAPRKIVGKSKKREKQVREQIKELISVPIRRTKLKEVSFKEAIASLDPKKVAPALILAGFVLAGSRDSKPIEPSPTEPVVTEAAPILEPISTETMVPPTVHVQSTSSPRTPEVSEAVDIPIDQESPLDKSPVVFQANSNTSIFNDSEVKKVFGEEPKMRSFSRPELFSVLNQQGWVPFVDSRHNLNIEFVVGINRMCVFPRDNTFTDPGNPENTLGFLMRVDQFGLKPYGDRNTGITTFQGLTALPLTSDIPSNWTCIFAKKLSSIDPDRPYTTGSPSLLLIHKQTGFVERVLPSGFPSDVSVEFIATEQGIVIIIDGEQLAIGQ